MAGAAAAKMAALRPVNVSELSELIEQCPVSPLSPRVGDHEFQKCRGKFDE